MRPFVELVKHEVRVVAAHVPDPRQMPPLRHKPFSCNMLSRYLSIRAPIPCTIRAWTGPDRLNRPRTHRRPRRHDGRADSSRNHRRLETGYAEPIPDLMAADDDEAALLFRAGGPG